VFVNDDVDDLLSCVVGIGRGFGREDFLRDHQQAVFDFFDGFGCRGPAQVERRQLAVGICVGVVRLLEAIAGRRVFRRGTVCDAGWLLLCGFVGYFVFGGGVRRIGAI